MRMMIMMTMMITMMMANTSGETTTVSVRNAYTLLVKKRIIGTKVDSLFLVPTTMPTPTTTPEGKKDKTISKVAMMVMMIAIL